VAPSAGCLDGALAEFPGKLHLRACRSRRDVRTEASRWPFVQHSIENVSQLGRLWNGQSYQGVVGELSKRAFDIHSNIMARQERRPVGMPVPVPVPVPPIIDAMSAGLPPCSLGVRLLYELEPDGPLKVLWGP